MNASYIVQSIIDRKVYSGKVLYKIKWKGLDERYATWQSVKMLKNCKDLIKQFAHNNRNKKMTKNQQDYIDDQKDQNTQAQKQNEVAPEIKLERQQKQIDKEQNKEQDKVQEKEQDKVKINVLPPFQLEDIAPSANVRQYQKDKNIDYDKKQLASPLPKVPKRRGRPPKKLLAQLNQQKLSNAVVKQKTITEGLSDTVKRYLRFQKNRLQQVFQIGIQATLTKNQSKEDKQTNTSTDNLQKEIKIYVVEPSQHEVMYTVVQADGSFRKYSSNLMLRLYPQQLKNFLEQSLFQQTRPKLGRHLF